MALRTLATRRILRPVVALTIAGTTLVGFAGAASADSTVSSVTASACSGGTTGRDVSVAYVTNASFSTGVRIHAVLGSPTGSIVRTIELELQGPASATITVAGLAPGTYWFDWEDRSGDMVTWSGRHSGLGDYYNGVYLNTETVVAECVVAPTTTAAPATTAPAATTTTTVAVNPPTTPAATTTVAVGTPTTQATATTSTTVAVNPPTTAVVRTTAAASANTLPSTGANHTPLVGAGVAFLGLGTVAVLSTRRRPARQV